MGCKLIQKLLKISIIFFILHSYGVGKKNKQTKLLKDIDLKRHISIPVRTNFKPKSIKKDSRFAQLGRFFFPQTSFACVEIYFSWVKKMQKFAKKTNHCPTLEFSSRTIEFPLM
jgi:hypothetical protein